MQEEPSQLTAETKMGNADNATTTQCRLTQFELEHLILYWNADERLPECLARRPSSTDSESCPGATEVEAEARLVAIALVLGIERVTKIRAGGDICWYTEETEHDFAATPEELDHLVRCWSYELGWEWIVVWFGLGVGHTDFAVTAHADKRLGALSELLGSDRVDEVIEALHVDRFPTKYFTRLSPGSDRTAESELFFTSAAKCIVFHGSRSGLRPGLPDVPCNPGWCWQTATEFKSRMPVQLSRAGFENAEAALAASQQWEREYFEKANEKAFMGDDNEGESVAELAPIADSPGCGQPSQ